MIQMKEKCLKSYKGLEAVAVKNKSQVCKLQENIMLYERYAQYQSLIEIISKSTLVNLYQKKETPYLMGSEIVYFGAEINMINKYLCRTTSSCY